MLKAVLRKEHLKSTETLVPFILEDEENFMVIHLCLARMAKISSFFNDILCNYDKSRCRIWIRGVSVEELHKYLSALHTNPSDMKIKANHLLIARELGIPEPATCSGKYSREEIPILLWALRSVYKMKDWCYVLLANNLESISREDLTRKEIETLLTMRFAYINGVATYLFTEGLVLPSSYVIDWRGPRQYVRSKEGRVEIHYCKSSFFKGEVVAVSSSRIVLLNGDNIRLIDYKARIIIAQTIALAPSHFHISNEFVYYLTEGNLVQWEPKRKRILGTGIQQIWMDGSIPAVARELRIDGRYSKIHQWYNVEVFISNEQLAIIKDGRIVARFPSEGHLIHLNRLFHCDGETIFLYDLETDINYPVCEGRKLLNFI